MMKITEQELSKQPQTQDDDIVLSVSGVSKRFCRDLKRSLMYGMQDIASELVGLRGDEIDTLRPKEFWALKDISFQLRRGEALGLVGKNGSGKSTLLRVIAGLIKPDTGSIAVSGRVAPLIALGAGFNPILTGRENIYANMSILGVAKKDVDERFDAVVDFAEIGDAIDSPVQSYSSGMAARLGFACAIYTEPDILLIDEVLAVGDIKFRGKCHRRLQELRQKGVSFILVSHQAPSILNVCTKAIYLLKGERIEYGDTHSVMNLYENDLFWNGKKPSLNKLALPEKNQNESLGFDITSLFFRDGLGNIVESIVTGEPATLCVKYKAYEKCKVDKAYLSFAIIELAGEGDFMLRISSFDDGEPLAISLGEHEFQVQMPYVGLKPGLYTMMLFVKEDSLYELDSVESFRFEVTAKTTMARCLFYQPRTWISLSSEDRQFPEN